MAVVGLNNLCTPAILYLALSMVAIVVMWIQNMGNESIYCLGSYNCNVSSTTLIFIIKILFVLFWTWVLNIMCKAGFSYVSWFFVLFPFILFFIILASIFFVEFENPFSQENISRLQNVNIPFFSQFYQWLRY
jgi:hypothetical protein